MSHRIRSRTTREERSSWVSLTRGYWRYAGGAQTLLSWKRGGEIEEMFCASHYTSKHKERGRFTMISGIKEASFPEAVPFQLMVNGELPD